MSIKKIIAFFCMVFAMMFISGCSAGNNGLAGKSYSIPPAPTAAQYAQAIASFPKAAGIDMSVNKTVIEDNFVVPEWGFNGWCENPGTPVQYVDWQTWVVGDYPQIWQYDNWIYSFNAGVWRLMTVAKEGQDGGVFLRNKYSGLPDATPGYDYICGAISVIYHINTATGERVRFGTRYTPYAFLTYYDPNY